MSDREDDLRDCPSAYECRDRLPELAAWMSEDELKQIRIWKGTVKSEKVGKIPLVDATG